MSQLTEDEKARGVIACSAGNHAQGVALAAQKNGVQASGAPSMLNSIHDAHIERLDSVFTIADGIAVKEPGSLTYELCSKYVDEIVTVTDDEISAAALLISSEFR